MEYQSIGFRLDVHPLGSKEFGFDRMKTSHGVRPCIDFGIELGKAAGEHLRALPADPRNDPGLLSGFEIFGDEGGTQSARPGKRVVDLFSYQRSVALGCAIEGLGR